MIEGIAPSIRRILLNVIRVFTVGIILILPLYGQTGNVSGTITDASRRVLVGARVQVDGSPLTTSSDDSGKYILLGVPAGTTKVTVSYLGFESSTLEISVAPH